MRKSDLESDPAYRVLAQRRARYRVKRAEILVNQRIYYAKHRPLFQKHNSEWQRNHPEESKLKDSNRRARKLGNGGTHTVQEWLDKCALLGNVCIYCGNERPLERDHKVPLINGGTNDIGNLLPACRPCNSSKGRKSLAEFLVYRTLPSERAA